MEKRSVQPANCPLTRTHVVVLFSGPPASAQSPSPPPQNPDSAPRTTTAACYDNYQLMQQVRPVEAHGKLLPMLCAIAWVVVGRRDEFLASAPP